MISDGSPIKNSTEVRRRCSSSIVPTSLKNGTTMDSSGAPGALRDMTEAPSKDVSEVVPDQFEALADQKRACLFAAEKGKLSRTRLEQPCARLQQRLVDVTGVHHQFGHPRPGRTQERVER